MTLLTHFPVFFPNSLSKDFPKLIMCDFFFGSFFNHLPLTVLICVVRDFKALHYQTASVFIKCFKVQINKIAQHYVYLLLPSVISMVLISSLFSIVNSSI